MNLVFVTIRLNFIKLLFSAAICFLSGEPNFNAFFVCSFNDILIVANRIILSLVDVDVDFYLAFLLCYSYLLFQLSYIFHFFGGNMLSRFLFLVPLLDFIFLEVLRVASLG